jgi:hypothetical protein
MGSELSAPPKTPLALHHRRALSCAFAASAARNSFKSMRVTSPHRTTSAAPPAQAAIARYAWYAEAASAALVNSVRDLPLPLQMREATAPPARKSPLLSE